MSDIFDDLNVYLTFFIERESTPNWSLAYEVINFHDLTYIVSGTAVYSVNQKAFHVTEGDVIYLPKGSIRQAYTTPDNSIHSYALNFLCFAGGRELIKLPFPTTFKLNMPAEMLSLYESISRIWLERKPGFNFELRAYLMLILSRMYEFTSGIRLNHIDNKRIEVVKLYIHKNFHEKMTVEALAELCNLNPVYFGSYFKKITGCTVKEYINRIRIHKAHDMLLSGIHTVTEVAECCGFDDVFYFSKIYKKIKGYPPSETIEHYDTQHFFD